MDDVLRERRVRSIFWAQEGFSTVGMALALLITLSLIFTCARVYEIQAVSADVQDVADAAALAAENMVAEYYLVVTICDAVTLTLSLTMVLVAACAVVCACVPPAAAVSKALAEAADKLRRARDSFYDSSTEALGRIQVALPFLATVQAQQVMTANGSEGVTYQGLAVLIPTVGEEAPSLSNEQSDEALASVLEEREAVEDAATRAEEAAVKARDCKEEAWHHDSGSRSEYCLYERASMLAGLSGGQNPYYASVDTWSFSVALDRSRAYYAARLVQETPQGTSTAEQTNSVLRKYFYAFAVDEMARGYVHETSESFDAEFPLLPKNTDEMRTTSLYTDVVYPVSVDGAGMRMIHAWQGCPGMAGGQGGGLASLKDADGVSGWVVCGSCGLRASSMGSVAAASTNIENGFEYHYNAVARAAAEYEQARSELDPLSSQVRSQVEGLFEKLGSALDEVLNRRIEMAPPGRAGAVVLVVASGALSTRFPSAFVQGAGVESLGFRAAVSAATLVREPTEEGKNVITSFLTGLETSGGAALGSESVVLSLWSGMLEVYTEGHEALVRTVGEVLDGIPLASESGLGTWASDSLENLVAQSGFEPPDLSARKAVVVNSSHVIETDDSAFSSRLAEAKLKAAGATSVDGVLSAVETAALEVIDDVGEGFTVATIVVVEGVVELPITVALPEPATGALSQTVHDGIESIRKAVGSWTGVVPWR